MKKSHNPQVQKFLSDIKIVDEEKYLMMEALRAVVFTVSEVMNEKIMYGGIMFTHNNDFGGIFPSKKHVSFEFSNGYLFSDPQKHLEGTGKKRRHLKFVEMNDIKNKNPAYYIEQALKLDTDV